MMTIIYNEDISLSNANAIVNASNGWGIYGRSALHRYATAWCS